jgi:selenocysteine lyase/cysteine desulfurase
MKARNRVMTWLAMNAPVLNTIRIAAMRRTMVSPARRERALRRDLAATPPAAHADVRIEFEAVADALARRAAAGLAAGGAAEVLNDITLNQVLFRVPGASADDVIQDVQRDGTCWLGGTTWQGGKAIRLSVSGWSTTEADIDRSVAAIRAAAEARRTGVCPPDQQNSDAGQVILGQ